MYLIVLGKASDLRVGVRAFVDRWFSGSPHTRMPEAGDRLHPVTPITPVSPSGAWLRRQSVTCEFLADPFIQLAGRSGGLAPVRRTRRRS
jgi:hypothetical protein